MSTYDELVERMARAMVHSRWPQDEPILDGDRGIARIALDAVHDELLAQGWDEGYRSGHSNAMRRMSDEPNVPATPNPHREG